MASLRLPVRAVAGTGVVLVCTTLPLAHAQVTTSAHELDPAVATDTTVTGEGPCRESGTPLRHIVVFPEGTQQRRADDAVTDACGRSTAYYPEIAVAVATSADPGFAARLPDGARSFSAQHERTLAAADSPSRHTTTGERPELRPTDPATVPADDRTSEQWNMEMINAPQAHTISRGDPDVIVGVLDSGIDPRHPDLAGSVDEDLSVDCLSGAPRTGSDVAAPDTSPHGTHVAGTIAAADDGEGITGVAPGVTLASIKVIGGRGFADPEAVVCGLMWAADNGMAVTNSSYVVDPWSLSCATGEDVDTVREAVARAADHANSGGTLNIAAATNDGVDLSPATSGGDGCQALPASLRSMVTISAVDAAERKAGYSSYGLGVIATAAPGGDERTCVLSTVPGGYTRICGSSMAAPHATGVAALIASANPDYDPERIASALTASAADLACPADYDVSGNGRQDAYCSGYSGYNGFYGHGLVDAYTALSTADSAGAGVGPS
ncbi:S8 family serine peptidase [Haloechinothrix sp. LS1_15]|uniref:S8 family peptidase n=1 Tax=Haloechinothrix sp. LS1_15 TaxID=2652248 RepID=UPI00294B000A|nr:S8 family serine peptidase [Haloechinothrix sp. LS1_15]